MPDATFACPDLTTFCRLDELGLEVTGQHLAADRAVLACRITDDDSWCRRCGEQGTVRDSVTRQLAHEPFGWRPTTLLVMIRHYRCAGCAHVWRQDSAKAAEPRAKLSRRGLRWALEAIVCQHLSVARIAEALAVSWNTANNAVLAEGRRVLIADPDRFDSVAVIGVDEHVWRHTRRGDKYVTVIIDLTPVRDKTGPARLLDMVEGRSKKAFQDWLADRPKQWRDGVEVVAMDGFSGFKTATTEELPGAATVMDPFHVVRLAGNALDECRRRVQLDTCGHRGRKTDPLYACRRTLQTGADLLTDKQKTRLNRPVLHRRPCRGRGHLDDVSAHRGRLSAPRPQDRPHHDGRADHHAERRRPQAPARSHHARADAEKACRRRPGLLRPARHFQRADRSDQRPPRTPTRLSPGLSQPHQLHRQIPTGNRRFRPQLHPDCEEPENRLTQTAQAAWTLCVH